MEIIPIEAERIGWFTFTKGKLKIAAAIAITPKTSVVNLEKLVSSNFFFEAI